MEAVYAFGGIVVGFVLSSALQLWQRALDAQGAARLIRMETVSNRVKVQEGAPSGHLTTSDWQVHAPKIVQFLSEMEMSRVSQSYSELTGLGLMLDIEARGRSERGGQRVREWVENTQRLGKMLRRIEDTAPWVLALAFLRPLNVATLEEIRKEYPDAAAVQDALSDRGPKDQ